MAKKVKKTKSKATYRNYGSDLILPEIASLAEGVPLEDILKDKEYLSGFSKTLASLQSQVIQRAGEDNTAINALMKLLEAQLNTAKSLESSAKDSDELKELLDFIGAPSVASAKSKISLLLCKKR